MYNSNKIPHRDPQSKNLHIEACLNPAAEFQKSAGFENFEFENNALPNTSLASINTGTTFCNKQLSAPLMIAPMTGGVEQGHLLNQRFARAAEQFQIPIGVGSQRIGIEKKGSAQFFKIREQAPTTLIFANIGAVQLNKGWGIQEALQAVEMIEADALFLHLNPMQEAIQGGDDDFGNLSGKISQLVKEMKQYAIPVFVREVGFGISSKVAQRLIDCGVSGLDCAGAGGTSWAKVEGLCAKSPRRQTMGRIFGEWGIPTSECIKQVRSVNADIPLIATGGLRSGIDLAKALALGADIGAMARPMLIKASESEEALHIWIQHLIEELKICMFAIGAQSIMDLKNTNMLLKQNN